MTKPVKLDIEPCLEDVGHGKSQRYVEICIHLETTKRQLLAELAGVV